MNYSSILFILLTISTFCDCIQVIVKRSIDEKDSKKKSRTKRQASCSPKVKLKCEKPIEKRYTYYVYYQESDIDWGCNDPQISKVTGTLTNKKTSKSTDISGTSKQIILAIKPRVVSSGTYDLTVSVTEKNGATGTDTCEILYVSEPPQIIFKHGYVQYVHKLTYFTVDIRESIYHDDVIPDNFKWSVVCGRTKAPLCKDAPCKVKEMGGTRFTALHTGCFEMLRFTVTIVHDGHKYSKSHVIKLLAHLLSAQVDMICEKNCDSAGSERTNVDLPAAFKLVCKLNCLSFDKWTPTWLVKTQKKNLTSDIYTIVNKGKRLIIKAKTLKPDTYHFVEASYPNQFSSSVMIKTAPKIIPPTCDIQPREGIALQTEFEIKCTIEKGHLKKYAPYYNVHQTVGGEKHLLTSSASQSFKVVIAAPKGEEQIQLEIKGHDMFYNKFELLLPKITVKDIELTSEKLAEISEQIKKHLEMGGDKGIQAAGGLLRKLKDSNLDKEEVQKAYISLIKGLTALDVDTMLMYEQIIGLTPQLIAEKDMSNKYKKALSKLCKKLSALQIERLYKSLYVKYHEDEAKQQAETMHECADKLLEKSEDDKEPLITTTTPESWVNETVVEENYADYEMAFSNSNVEEIKSNGINVIEDASKSIATTLNAGENYTLEKNNSLTLITNEEGTYMAGKRLELKDAALIPSSDFADIDDVVTAVLTNFEKDTLTPNADISTAIVNVDFYLGKNPLNNVTYDLELKLKDDTVEFVEYEVEIPPPSRAWYFIEKRMNVHRLNLFASEKSFVRFEIDPDIILDVAITSNKRPRKKDFERPYEVDASKPGSLGISYPFGIFDRNQFIYVAVIPSAKMQIQNQTNRMVKYKIQLSEIACMLYNKGIHNWVATDKCLPSLSSSENGSIIICTCKQTSLHSARLKPIQNRLDKQMEITYTIVDFVNYIIFFHVFVVFVCYCIALSMVIKRKQKVFGRDKIYFLSDNLKNDRYAYMLVVKTGTYSGSGTTANIMFQLYGSKTDSKPHVLNYPDPACKLLQRDGIDWMIITHHMHLGNIDSITLWTDSIGLYAPWYCENIKVFDLQTFAEWFFPIEAWMSASPKHVMALSVNSTKLDDMSKPTIVTSLAKHFRFYVNGLHTWNIFARSDDEFITYAERVTVIVSMIYTTYCINMILIGTPFITRSDAFGYGMFQFYNEHITFPVISSLVCSAIHLPIVYLFRNSERTQKSQSLVQVSRRFKYKTRKGLWIFLTVWITICMSYLITFGFGFTPNSTYLWTCCTFVSLLISIFAIENCFIIIVQMVHASFLEANRETYDFPSILREVERQRVILFKKFGEVLLRPYFKKHYRQLTPNEIFDLRSFIDKRGEISALFKDMCLFILFIGLLYILCLMHYDDSAHESNRKIRQIFEEGVYTDEKFTLDDIHSTPDIYKYIEVVIIGALHPAKWYGKWYSLDAGLMVDFSTRILGIAQLRQQRTKQVCNIPAMLQALKIPCSNENPVFDQMHYYNGSDITPTLGKMAVYSGKGYILHLGRTLHNSLFVLKLLRTRNWIDINTKVLFIEFLTYNANDNVFHAIRVVIERSPTGYIAKSLMVYTTTLIYDNYAQEIIIGFLHLLLTFVILLMLVKRLVSIATRRLGYFNDFWNILDIILSILSVTTVILFFLRKTLTDRLMKKFVDSDNNQFVNYFHVMTLSQGTTIVYAILLSLATVRLWKFLRFGTIFQVMERTILKASPQLFGVLCTQVCIYFQMAVFIYPMYGSNLFAFRNFLNSIMHLYLASINYVEHLDNIYMNLAYGPCLYLVYSIFLIISTTYLNLYATTIIMNLEECKIYYSNQGKPYTIKTYVKDEAIFQHEKLMKHLEHTRLQGGQDQQDDDRNLYHVDVDKLIYPKSANHRYADMVCLNKRKMKLMRYVALSVIQNLRRYGRKKISEEELVVMGHVIGLMITPDDTDAFAHMFFKGRDPASNGFKFIPDSKMLQMELVVKKLLAGDILDLEMQKKQGIVIHAAEEDERLDYFINNLELIKDIVEHIVVVDDE